MRRRLLALALAGSAAAAPFVLSVPAAHADGQVCYDLQINVNGQPQGQAGCVPLTLPSAP
jgi:hypothetical protein